MRLIQEFKQYPAIHRIFSLVQDQEDAAFLDSSLKNQLGRYSIIGLSPYLKLVQRAPGQEGRQETDGLFTVNGQACTESSFADWVRDYLRTHQEENDTALPLVSGAIGYFSYDYGRKKEGVVSRHPQTLDIPDCILIFYDNFILEDHQEHRLYLVANDHSQQPEEGIELMRGLLSRAEDSRPLPSAAPATSADPGSAPSAGQLSAIPADPGSALPSAVTANFTKSDYMAAVQKMIQYIVEGDIYIANMTQQLQITSPMAPFELFRKMRETNPSPFGGYFNYGDFQIVSASPERFLQMRGGQVETRPIKGTRKRGATPGEDAALRLELEQSQKDQSELLMIVDLERNDLNRVCVPGSVKVTELFSVETYATVFHLISNVVGTLQPGLTVMDLLEAAFPGGSITGAPKLRAMELIDELEHSRRNLYTGSIGYLSLDGDCDFNIVIRTALYQNGVYHLGVGGGITCESELEFEYEETLQKAKAFLELFGCGDFSGN